MNRHAMSDPGSHGIAGTARVACALWLLAGFIGASALAAGILQWFDDGAKPLPALILAIFGGTLAATGGVHARAALDRAEHEEAIADRSPTGSTGAR
jgi:hypothetical protein